ncbi:hypothetical protein B0H13DRAFT_2309232 [Mycena leptocephala]|nr:hypothetical protein B0H13DRAFT_2309232 [Mycena leptocephala]
MLFHDLHEDVLSDILTYCDIYTVVSFSEVSRYSRVVALSKQLWRSLILGLSARHYISNLHAIDDYTTEQLIAEARRFVCGPVTWSAKSTVPATVSSSNTFLTNDETRLLPGGRYFLVLSHDAMQVYDAVTGSCVWFRPITNRHEISWGVEMRDDGKSAVFFFFVHYAIRHALSIVQADFSTGLSDIHFDCILNSRVARSRPPVLSGNLLGVDWGYRCPYSKNRERGMLVIDWRKQQYVIFDCSTVSGRVTNLAISPKLI